MTIQEEFEQYKRESIKWSVEDFILQAYDLEENEWGKVYDKDLFQDALEQMIDKHDPTIGITWDTITYYLNEYCRKDENSI